MRITITFCLNFGFSSPYFSSVVALTLLKGIQQGSSWNSSKHFADDMSGPLSPVALPAPKQLKFTPGIVNGSVRESAAFVDQTRKVIFLQNFVFSIVVFRLDQQARDDFSCRWFRLVTCQ